VLKTLLLGLMQARCKGVIMPDEFAFLVIEAV